MGCNKLHSYPEGSFWVSCLEEPSYRFMLSADRIPLISDAPVVNAFELTTVSCLPLEDFETVKPPTEVRRGVFPSLRDRYAIRRRIGAGGMGEVFEVYDAFRERTLAMKIPSQSELWPGFVREAKAMSVL